jgi:microsomal dipeptidase-like Zn-dependent dipeptidase
VSDDVLRALAAKGGLVGILATADAISERYFDWTRTHPPVPVGGVTRPEFVRAEMPLLRPPERDYGAYIEALDAHMGGLWRRFYSQPWRDAPDAEALVPTVDEWTDHIAHGVEVAGAAHVAIGLDLSQGKSTLKNFDARGYPRLVEVLRSRKMPPDVLGENWLRVLDAAKVP